MAIPFNTLTHGDMQDLADRLGAEGPLGASDLTGLAWNLCRQLDQAQRDLDELSRHTVNLAKIVEAQGKALGAVVATMQEEGRLMNPLPGLDPGGVS